MSLCPAKSFGFFFTVLCDCKALQPLQLLVCVWLSGFCAYVNGFVRLCVETAGGERTKRVGLAQVKRGV